MARTTETPWSTTPSGQRRARSLGLDFQGQPGHHNSITDVPGVGVGYATIIQGNGRLTVGKGPVRTGVTAILPRPTEHIHCPVFGSCFSFNGYGELTGAHILDEIGRFSLPLTITNTHSCGTTRDATLKWAAEKSPELFKDSFGLPLAAETYDGFLNDINGFHVTTRHVYEAISGAAFGAIEEGSVGGGTGMKAFGFKAGSGTSSRVINYATGNVVVGVFVQANFGNRKDLTILGKRIGHLLAEPAMIEATPDTSLSSIIAVIATDAPLLPHQLKRIAKRTTLGLARTGSIGNNRSGDIFIAFSTANRDALALSGSSISSVRFLDDEYLNPLFEGTVQATEEAILNSLVANESMTGRDGNYVPSLPLEVVKEIFADHAI